MSPPPTRPPTFVDRVAAHARLGRIAQPSRLGALLATLFSPLVGLLWRPRATGWEQLPAGPCLIVVNHSGGGVVDVLAIVSLFWRRFGLSKKTTGMAHPLAFFVPGVALCLRALGAIPSTREHALAAFRENASVIVFPGGDYEGFRPVWQANVVDWNGRAGFARLARDAWVPIVPAGFRGTSYTGPILWRSSLLPWLLVVPRALGIKRLPLSFFWLAGLIYIIVSFSPDHSRLATVGVAYAWSLFPLAWQLPWVPWTASLRFGPPLSPEELFGAREATGPVDDAGERVRAAVERCVRST